MKKIMLLSIISFSLLVALLLLMNATYASPGVGLVTYPRHVVNAVPHNDDNEGYPVYRLNRPNASTAPFAVILRVVGHKGQEGYFWLTDNQTGNTVQTFNRFAPGANKDLPPDYWLDEDDAPSVAPVNITAEDFYLMVIGRITGTVNSPIITYTVNYTVGTTSGSINFTSQLIEGCYDWYLNWNDNNPESGDPASGADYVELFDPNLNSFTTAPIDEEGYFEVVLPNNANGQTWSAQAKSESGSPLKSWVTTISADYNKCSELIDAGTGGPTKVELVELSTEAALYPFALVLAIVLVLIPAALFFTRRRKFIL